jgi:hypothetical protein
MWIESPFQVVHDALLPRVERCAEAAPCRCAGGDLCLHTVSRQQ